jgi:ABC-type enterobactin transport system permease subunit
LNEISHDENVTLSRKEHARPLASSGYAGVWITGTLRRWNWNKAVTCLINTIILISFALIARLAERC